MDRKFNLLHQIVSLFQNRKQKISELLKNITLLLPDGCENPITAAARIVYNGSEFTTPKCIITPCMQKTDFSVYGKIGSIEIIYSEVMHIECEDRYSLEDKIFIDHIAKLLKIYLELRDITETLFRSTNNLKMITEFIPAIIYVGYIDWSIDVYDNKVEEITGFGKDLFHSRQMRWSDIVLHDDLYSAKIIFINALRTTKAYVREYRIRDKHGNIKWIQERSYIVCDPAGKIDHVCGIFFDISDRKQAEKELDEYREHLEELVEKRTYDLITAIEQLRQEIEERKRAENALKESEQLYRTLAENFPNGAVLLIDLEMRCVLAEGRGLDSLGIDKNRIKGEFVDTIFPHELKEIVKTHFQTAISGQEIDFEVTLNHQVFHIYVVPVLRGIGQVFAEMIMTQNITERKHMEEMLRKAATVDVLTGLCNRRRLLELLNSATKYSKRYGTKLSLCMCDIDNFKGINDNYGHKTGDMVLIQYAKIMQTNIRETDFSARYGGDEFCIVLPNTDKRSAMIVIDRIRNSIAEIIFYTDSGETFHVTGSFGVAELRDENIGAAELMEHADKALYTAKQAGRNRVTLY